MTNKKRKLEIQEIKIMNKKPRNVDTNTQLLLFSKTAGRCEVCNQQVTKDIRTGTEIIWGEKAHIYAFNPGGARTKPDKAYLNKIDNLLLACPNCHGKMDKKLLEGYYTAKLLKEMKIKHERRVEIATGIGEEGRTKVLKMIANINEEKVTTDQKAIHEALLNERLILADQNYCEIDFTGTSGYNTKAYWEQKKAEIDEKLNVFYQEVTRDRIENISIFAIGPMPLLIHLGSRLNNKIKTGLFQRHKDGEDWKWKKGKSKSNYSFRRVQEGKDKTKVALLISISGFIERIKLPAIINKDYFIYEISLDTNPNYNCIRTKGDLHKFEKKFTTAIAEIKNNHEGLQCIDLFPAVPAPIAVTCGRSLNKNADPNVRIYNTSLKKRFKYSLTIN